VNSPRMFGGLHHDVLVAFAMNDELASGNNCAAFQDLAHFHLLALPCILAQAMVGFVIKSQRTGFQGGNGDAL
jgi:hypothetical protein